jgi:S-adenosylmethionine:tRNA ribosyltransferase-isomerase
MEPSLKTSDFDFDLPEHLIAQHPAQNRGDSRLMLLDRQTGKRRHLAVKDLPEILCSGNFRTAAGLPLLVFNNSKVRKARLFAKSAETGAAVEFLLLENVRQNGCGEMQTWKALVHRSKRRKPGSVYVFFDAAANEAARAQILPDTGFSGAGEGGVRLVKFDRRIDDAWLDLNGHIPLPPYIKRTDSGDDADRYQTVYASVSGSAAAPTAGLHFTRELLGQIAGRGIESVFVTLHVGLGTFLPVRSGEIKDHTMHRETCTISEEAAAKIEEAKKQGRKIVAVGTTSVRTLESAWQEGKLKRGEFETSIFIYPGFRFGVTDAMFTNFHTPQSTLLMLVSAFAGRQPVLESYAEAAKGGYRFFSYGDAMLVG